MTYTRIDIVKYIPDLTKYIKSKIISIDWEDVLHDTLLYLLIKFDDIIITNLKGLIINTGKIFINKYFYNQSFNFLEDLDESSLNSNEIQSHDFFESGYNTEYISDTLLNNLNNVSDTLLTPFKLKLEDYSIKEISKKLNLNENTVKTRLKRCKMYLKQNM